MTQRERGYQTAFPKWKKFSSKWRPTIMATVKGQKECKTLHGREQGVSAGTLLHWGRKVREEGELCYSGGGKKVGSFAS